MVEPEFPNLLFPVDGNIFELPTGNSDKPVVTMLVMGGAYSVDKYYCLKNGLSWFADEQPSDESKARLWRSLEKCGNCVDVIASHTCPSSQTPIECFLPWLDQSTVDKSTEYFLEDVYQACTFEHWCCGHWHTDKVVFCVDGSDIRFLFKDIISLY